MHVSSGEDDSARTVLAGSRTRRTTTIANGKLDDIIDELHIFELSETMRIADGYAHSRRLVEKALERAGEGAIWLFDAELYNNIAIYKCVAVAVNLDTDSPSTLN